MSISISVLIARFEGASIGRVEWGKPMAKRKKIIDDGLLLGERAYLRMKELLLTGTLNAGQYVSTQELVEMLDCPLAPTREAVKRVANEGLLRIVAKRGMYVMDVTPDLIRQCFELRALFDQEGARILAAAAEQPSFDALRAAHVRVLEAAQNEITPDLQREAKDVDWRLHETLAGSLRNPLVTEIYERNRERIRIMQNVRPLLPDRIVPAMEEHLGILDTIATRRPDAAAQAVREHCRQTLRWWGILT